MANKIIKELKEHAPFTFMGALIGILLMVAFNRLPDDVAYNAFYVLHPLHVLLSALVTASLFKLNKEGKVSIWLIFVIGYVGSIGIATLSDSLIPFLGEVLLNMPNRHIHIGFIEKWYLVNPLAILGIAIAYFKPTTKFPHAGHVLLSTWASLFHMLMARGGASLSWGSYPVIFIFLFIAVWFPCCLSDIIFPLLFIKDKKEG
jgi:hypothetical protein